jgi:hypothetical protein
MAFWSLDGSPWLRRRVVKREGDEWLVLGFYSLMGLWAALVVLRSLGILR